MIATPRAVAAIGRVLEADVVLEPEDVASLGWSVAPASDRLCACRVDARIVCYVHPRKGSWEAWFRNGAAVEPAIFVGVIEDALVFARQPIDDRLWTIGHFQGERHRLEVLPGTDLAGRPVLHSFRVAEWGAFPHMVLDGASDLLLEQAGVDTAVLRAVSAEAGGPWQVRIEHR